MIAVDRRNAIGSSADVVISHPSASGHRTLRGRVSTGVLWLLVLLTVLVVVAGAGVMLNLRGEQAIADDSAAPVNAASVSEIERGRYLATAGNCASCHTVRGGAPMAGGLGIETPFGTVFSSNLTPDVKTGLGTWSADHFWRAMHNGRSKSGRLLYPAFPYPNYTEVTREDSDAIYAWLRSQPPVAQPNLAHDLRFPFDTQVALGAWRALFFRPGSFEPVASESAQWNRGAYLVRGLGHCVACHSARNVFGATSEKLELSGGLIPVQNWYAPSLNDPAEAGVADWETAHVVSLLKTGVSPRGSVLGPMGEVVFRSTQYLSDDDLTSMAVFLKGLPAAPSGPAARVATATGVQREVGAAVYAKQCAQCHGDAGQGAAGAYPALAGNRTVTMASPVNIVRIVLAGGFLPATAGNPRPYGMPPFAQVLSNAELAAVVSFVRGSWGNGAGAVSEVEVLGLREGR
ncbi:MAG: putative alcohol dehydrogenase, cytochrome c subunit [Rhizobacter sp.]|nr:putative alcohol dehydrogenase, cytochrome c subunit [Rhizobacter sp.]